MVGHFVKNVILMRLTSMRYLFDLDNTLCTHETDYNDAKPHKDRIEKVNKLYDDGHDIIIDTARGYKTGINWRELTEKQLKDWGVKYHMLRTGVKIYADFYIDDRGIKDTDFFKA
jgi:hypothetical protein